MRTSRKGRSETDNMLEQDPQTPSTPPAGWYQDPELPTKLRYWDGNMWGPRQPDTPPENQSDIPKTRWPADENLDRATILAASLVLVVAPFLTWAKVFILGSLDLFETYEAAGSSSENAWIYIFLGLTSAWAGARVKSLPNAKLAGGAVGVISAVFIVTLLVAVPNSEFASWSLGPWIALIACAALVFSALRETYFFRAFTGIFTGRWPER